MYRPRVPRLNCLTAQPSSYEGRAMRWRWGANSISKFDRHNINGGAFVDNTWRHTGRRLVSSWDIYMDQPCLERCRGKIVLCVPFLAICLQQIPVAHFPCWPGEVALSCNLSYWEARIGNGYEQLLLNQPWETWHSGRIILRFQLDSDSPGTWHFRILDHQDDAHPLLSTTYQKGPGFKPPAVPENTVARPNPHIVILYRPNE
jgi:hypothetical protein